MGKYVSLHTHSEFSFLDGYASIKQIADRVKEINGTAVGLTDHGEVSGHIFLEEACKEVGITPIYGMEGYVVDSIEETKEAQFSLLRLGRNLEGSLKPLGNLFSRLH